MNSANDTFFLSFHGPFSMCRLSRGKCLKTAIEDAIQSATTTGLTSSILDKNLAVLGEVTVVQDDPRSPSTFVFFDANGVRQPLH